MSCLGSFAVIKNHDPQKKPGKESFILFFIFLCLTVCHAENPEQELKARTYLWKLKQKP